MRHFLLYASLCVIIGSTTLLLHDNWAAALHFFETPEPRFYCGTKSEALPAYCGNSGAYADVYTANNSIIDTQNGRVDGKALFLGKCASCHNPNMKAKSTGPALGGTSQRWAGRKRLLKKFIRNSNKVIRSGDAYANALYHEYRKSNMTAFPTLTDVEIDAILGYISVKYQRR